MGQARKRIHQFGGRAWAIAQYVKHGPPGGIGERLPHRIQLVGIVTGAGTWLLARFLELLQHVVPALRDALAVLRIDHANRPMTERDF